MRGVLPAANTTVTMPALLSESVLPLTALRIHSTVNKGGLERDTAAKLGLCLSRQALSQPQHTPCTHCRLAAGLTEEDFIGDSVREPLCSCLTKVAAALAALPVDGQLVHNAAELKAAVDNLKVSPCAHSFSSHCSHSSAAQCMCTALRHSNRQHSPIP